MYNKYVLLLMVYPGKYILISVGEVDFNFCGLSTLSTTSSGGRVEGLYLYYGFQSPFSTELVISVYKVKRFSKGIKMWIVLWSNMIFFDF